MRNYILNRLREKFSGDEEDDGGEGFPDMNYQIGNTSGLDVGNIPTPIARRIGSQAQIGGGLMEVQIYNPSTFYMHSEDIISVIDQLGLDITLHSDPNVGFASAYKTRGQQGSGIETVHPYFTRYLDALADFKEEVELKGGGEAPFRVGRINPHISTSPMPALEERMAADVGLDIFGYSMSELKQSPRKNSDKNIFRNPEFMKKFYKTFILNEVDEPYQIYQLFSRFSEEFRDEYWRKAQAEAANKFWEDIDDMEKIEDDDERIKEKIAMIQSARMKDQGIDKEWLEIVNSEVGELEESVGPFENLGDIGMDSLQRIIQIRYKLKDGERPPGVRPDEMSEDQAEQLGELIDEPLEASLDRLWTGNGDLLKMSADAKTQALTSRLDIQQQQVLELAQDLDEYSDELEDGVLKMMEMDDDFFEGGLAGNKTKEEKYRDMVQQLMNSFEQAMWMESNIFYYIIPCWMSESTESNENHRGWDAPKFIWESLVLDEWGDDYDIDLLNPDPEGEMGYFDLLEESDEFRRDVCAATAACYVWGHFTQMDSEFESGDETWMEFMNRHGIGVNLEAMEGNKQQLLKIWRPKDVAVAAHAINITARQELGDIHGELDQCIAKFTIDMEHVAAAGFDPWKEMKLMMDSEKRIGEKEDEFSLGIDPEKPLSKILRQYHLMKPGVESQQGTRHGPFSRGDKQLYSWLYLLVEAGFARNEFEPAAIMYEQGEEKDETIYTARIAMNLIELGVPPEEVTVDNVDVERAETEDYRDEKEALIARFFGIDKANYSREWAKIEEHAFDPLEGLLEAEEFGYTYSSKGALENDNSPQDYAGEEYQ